MNVSITKRKLRLIVISSIFVLVGFSIYNFNESFSMILNEGVLENNESIKIAVNVWPGYSHVFIAQEMGFFEKNGVNVELILNEKYGDSQSLYLNGDVDGVFEVYTDTIFHSADGPDSKVVYVTDNSLNADAVVGDIKKVSELRGKTIGIEGINSFSHIFVLKALEKNGMSEKDVFFETVPANEVYTALKEGKIDAGHTWEPVLTEAVNEGFFVMCTAGDLPGIITDVLVFNSDIVEQRPDEIKAIVKSMIESENFIRENEVKAIKIMASYLKISYEELYSGLKGVEILDHEQNILAMSGNHETRSLNESGKFIAEQFLARGQISTMPDIDSLVDESFVIQLQQEFGII